MKKACIFIKSIWFKLIKLMQKFTNLNHSNDFLNSIVGCVLNGEKLSVRYGSGTTFHTILRIHVGGKTPHVILDDEEETRVNFTEITGTRISK